MIPGFLSLVSSCGVKCGLAGASILILMELWRFLARMVLGSGYVTTLAYLFCLFYNFLECKIGSVKFWWIQTIISYWIIIAIYCFWNFRDVLYGTGNRKWLGCLTSLAAPTSLMDLASMVQTVCSLSWTWLIWEDRDANQGTSACAGCISSSSRALAVESPWVGYTASASGMGWDSWSPNEFARASSYYLCGL